MSAGRLCAGLPRAGLVHLPTPLEAAPRLAEALGAGRLRIKREDLCGLCAGGNKVRLMDLVAGALVAFFASLGLVPLSVLIEVTLEDGVVEYASAFAWMLGTVLCVRALVRGERRKRWLMRNQQ